jgi:ferredoxin
MTQVKVDKDKCIGCGLCTALAADVFEMGADGKADVKADANLASTEIKNAAESCPVQAITVE